MSQLGFGAVVVARKAAKNNQVFMQRLQMARPYRGISESMRVRVLRCQSMDTTVSSSKCATCATDHMAPLPKSRRRSLEWTRQSRGSVWHQAKIDAHGHASSCESKASLLR